MAVLKTYIDTVAPRVYLDRQAIYCDGRGWDLLNSSNVVVDDATNTAMLRPVQLEPNWQTTGTGVYARWRKADLIITTPAQWTESSLRFDGDYYVDSLNINEVVYTPTVERNRGVYLSYFNFGTGNENYIAMECGFGTPTTGRSFRIYSDGNVEVWVGSVMVGSVRITGEAELYRTPYGPLGAPQGAPGRAIPAQTVDLLIIPCRKREILIVSNQGGPANWLYTDIDPSVAVPTINPEGRFWFYVPTGKAKVSVAPMRYATSGYIVSPLQTLRYPPPTGTTLTRTGAADLPGYGSAQAQYFMCLPNRATIFVPDGSRSTACMRVNLAGDGSATPFVYWTAGELGATIAYTPNSPTDITPYVVQRMPPHLEVPESPSDVKLTLTLGNPAAAEAAGATYLRTIGNRPLSAQYGSIAILTGTTNSPQWKEGISDSARDLIIETRDRWKHCETYLMQDPLPLDDKRLDLGITTLIGYPGFPSSDVDADIVDFYIPSVPQASRGEFANKPEVGDKPAEWLNRLWETYARTFIMGWVPTAAGPKFRFRSPESLGVTPQITIYPTIALAGGNPSLVFRTYKETNLEPEANSIYVVGRDPRTELPLIAHYIDGYSVDPTIPVAYRPLNWLGEERRYSLVEPGITTIEDASYACGIIAMRLTPVRRMAEWECDLLPRPDGAPVWRGDCVRLYGYGVYRVNTISADLRLESLARTWRPATYTGEWVAP